MGVRQVRLGSFALPVEFSFSFSTPVLLSYFSKIQSRRPDWGSLPSTSASFWMPQFYFWQLRRHVIGSLDENIILQGCYNIGDRLEKKYARRWTLANRKL